MNTLCHVVRRGRSAGLVLVPHRHPDGCFVVSRTRFRVDQIRVRDEAELPAWISRGFGVRMADPTAPGRAASFIAASRLRAAPAPRGAGLALTSTPQA